MSRKAELAADLPRMGLRDSGSHREHVIRPILAGVHSPSRAFLDADNLDRRPALRTPSPGMQPALSGARYRSTDTTVVVHVWPSAPGDFSRAARGPGDEYRRVDEAGERGGGSDARGGVGKRRGRKPRPPDSA